MVALAVPVVLSELGWMARASWTPSWWAGWGRRPSARWLWAMPICYTPSLFGVGLMLGLDTLVAQAYGRKDHDECHRWLAQGVYLACIAAVPIMLRDFAGELWLHATSALRQKWPGRRADICACSTGAPCRCCSTGPRGAICRAWARCA